MPKPYKSIILVIFFPHLHSMSTRDETEQKKIFFFLT